MNTVPLFTDGVFDQKDIQAMSTALEEVCKILNLTDSVGSERELLAKKIVGLANQGHRDAALLRDRMLREIVRDRMLTAIASERGQSPLALVSAARSGAL